jgi:serine/threonine protein kinase
VALSSGLHLGPYEILAPLGAGGMGEVWRARDTRLGRDVAIKVLPEHLSAHPEARARFEREARAISSLNHPHICTLYDVGREDGVDFLVLELVEGESLAERLRRGPLPAETLLPTAIEIADALDRAHRSGVVHRDLKPGNIMLTRGGTKLLDFGLARSALPPAAASNLTSTPTLTRPLTAEGAIVGTFQYMAPEQLEGKETDARSDLWAFGAVLYEMTTGKRAFEGPSQASLIGAIMNKEPAPIRGLAPGAPAGLERVVGRCLAKDPDDRWQTARDVVNELRELAGIGPASSSAHAVVADLPARRPERRPIVAWIVAGVSVVVALAALGVLVLRPWPHRDTARFSVLVPEARTLEWPRISPDGRTLAFLGSDSTGKTMIWVRPLNSLTAVPLAGTDGAGRPFWSPDSRYLAYFLSSQLKKIPVNGGPPQLVCEVRGGSDGTWGSRGEILFDGSQGDSIRQVSAEGGEAGPATSVDRKRGELYHAWPCFLPDGRHFLFVSYGRGRDDSQLEVGTLGGKGAKVLGRVQTRVDYSPDGYVLYASDGTLMARRFDERGLRFTGEPFPVAERIRCSPADRANLSVSAQGTLAFMPGASSDARQMLWVDRTGRTLGAVGPPAAYNNAVISPDGTRIVYSMTDPGSGNDDLWVRDLRRDVASKLTFDPGNEIWPVWSPDGSRIAYAADGAGPFIVMMRPANGMGSPDTLFRSSGNSGPNDWARDGGWLAFTNFDAGNGDIWTLPVGAGGKAQPFLKSTFNKRTPMFSPDRRWVAYSSNESGRPEIYVQPFPGPGGKWQVSTHGGLDPRWRADGKEIYYLSLESELMAVPLTTATDFQAGIPVMLFDRTMPFGPATRNRYDVAADGKRFLVIVPAEGRTSAGFTVVMDWTAELRRR